MIGKRLGSWIIDKELGRGGMGCVYLARRAGPDGPEQSAIKVLAPELAVESGFLARFQREIEILRQLDHPNIVRFRESGQQDTRLLFRHGVRSGTQLRDASEPSSAGCRGPKSSIWPAKSLRPSNTPTIAASSTAI